jgi:hypothetical protein
MGPNFKNHLGLINKWEQPQIIFKFVDAKQPAVPRTSTPCPGPDLVEPPPSLEYDCHYDIGEKIIPSYG